MRWVILAIIGATLMVHGQESKPHSDAEKRNSTTTNKNEDDEAARTIIVVDQQTSHEQQNDHPADPPTFLHEYLLPQNVLTLALVIVGVIGIVVGICTLRTIGRQVTEMRRQVDLTFGQLRAMHEQITEMSKQSDALERSVGVAKDGADAALITAKATIIAAEAAKTSADTFVLSERAWIQVVISKPPVYYTEDRVTINCAWVMPDIGNVGRTPAKITKAVFVPYVIRTPLGPLEQMPPELPRNPDYSCQGSVGFERDAILAQDTDITPLTVKISGADFREITKRNATLYVYGFVDYLDVLDKPHRTCFCQLFWVKPAPDDPTPEGFMVAGNTPAAYTHCT